MTRCFACPPSLCFNALVPTLAAFQDGKELADFVAANADVVKTLPDGSKVGLHHRLSLFGQGRLCSSSLSFVVLELILRSVKLCGFGAHCCVGMTVPFLGSRLR